MRYERVFDVHVYSECCLNTEQKIITQNIEEKKIMAFYQKCQRRHRNILDVRDTHLSKRIERRKTKQHRRELM